MENETNKLEIIKPDQLEKIVNESGLQLNEGDEIKSSYLPFLVQLREVQDMAGKINFENPSEIDEAIAGKLRLKTVKIRTSAEELKKERKKMYLLRGNLEQASYNLIASSCKLTEEVFFNVEKAREIAEKKRKEQLKADRLAMISPYIDSAELYPLGEMSENSFNDFFAGLKIAYDNKIAAEKKAEEERIAQAEAEKRRQEEIKAENERLKKEAEEREKQLSDARAQAETERKAIEEEKRKQKEEFERRAEEERKKQDAIIADQRKRAEEEKRKIEENAKKEREEKEKLEREVKAMQKAREEDEKKKAQELARKKAEERKAALAPDKDKLLAFMQLLNDLPRPEVKSIEAAQIAANVNTLLVKVSAYILENANKL